MTSLSMPFVQYANEKPVAGSPHPTCLCAPACPIERGELLDAEAAVAHEVLAVVAGEHEPERAVDGHVHEVVGEHAAHVGLRVVEHVGSQSRPGSCITAW